MPFGPSRTSHSSAGLARERRRVARGGGAGAARGVGGSGAGGWPVGTAPAVAWGGNRPHFMADQAEPAKPVAMRAHPGHFSSTTSQSHDRQLRTVDKVRPVGPTPGQNRPHLAAGQAQPAKHVAMRAHPGHFSSTTSRPHAPPRRRLDKLHGVAIRPAPLASRVPSPHRTGTSGSRPPFSSWPGAGRART
jgi:hypothetical protein